MRKIVEESETIARKYLGDFGFAPEQVVSLLQSARRDLERELDRLEELIRVENPENLDREALDRVLHALKGLLFNLGHQKLADRFEALRSDGDAGRLIEEIKKILDL